MGVIIARSRNYYSLSAYVVVLLLAASRKSRLRAARLPIS